MLLWMPVERKTDETTTDTLIARESARLSRIARWNRIKNALGIRFGSDWLILTLSATAGFWFAIALFNILGAR